MQGIVLAWLQASVWVSISSLAVVHVFWQVRFLLFKISFSSFILSLLLPSSYLFLLLSPCQYVGPQVCVLQCHWNPRPSAFIITGLVLKYASSLDTRNYTKMQARNHAFTVGHVFNILRNTVANKWLKRWIYCNGRGMPLSWCFWKKYDCSFVPC